MHGCCDSSIRKKYVAYESLWDYHVYHTRDIENLGIYVLVKYHLHDLIQHCSAYWWMQSTSHISYI